MNKLTNLLSKFIVLSLFGLSLSGAAVAAGDKGTADEAIALVKKAITYMKDNGKEKAYAEISKTNGQFVDRDLYVFVFDMTGKTMAHGANPKLIDKNLIEMRDADGKYVLKSFLETANAKGKGWIDYKWPNPISKAVEGKSTYIEKVGDVIVGCGIYK
jgi:cytochrome c